MSTVTDYTHTNRLIDESSPYLLQHTHNPVDWYPWGDEAFERAKKEDKPVFLSIGYSTCHWCHVMERESFENEEMARILNDHFVSIKVDREQRPDVDEIYMNAVVMMTGSGGWPLSVFLTPGGQPFYGGTYFPPKDAFGRPGFERILLSIAESWKNKRQQLIESAGKLSEYLKRPNITTGRANLSPALLDRAFEQFYSSFDALNGGFGSAPKFPQPTNLSMLLGYWHRTGDEEALRMVEKTLDAMAKGGIYDHLGGGFHRYATDARWLVPHFEKMLYDQALLSKVYLQAYQITQNPRYADVARDIFDYVLRDLTDPAGGFYSAEDADSDGEEGTFYLWDAEQISSILKEEEAQLFNAYYGVTDKGNFEKGKTILNIVSSTEALARQFQSDPAGIAQTLTSARRKLFQARSKRNRPHRDDKVITSWNGLMISSLAYGGMVLDEPKYTQAAVCSTEFILSTLYVDNRLRRYYRDGRVIGKGFLDDYVFVVAGLLDLYEATFDVRWLVEAKKLSEQMIELFADSEGGGFFLTGKDSEKLIARSKPGSDGTIPSGNSIAAMALLRLSQLTMNQNFSERGNGILEAFSLQLEQSPAYSSSMLIALDFWLGPRREVIIAGNRHAEDTHRMLMLVRSRFLPNAVVILHDQGQTDSALESIIPFLKHQVALDGKATAYVCENYTCQQPVNDMDDFERLLISNTPSPK
ncbi:MAG: thioredoxin domain-containing protein [Sedimentisphaerales bacterium]|nr:thioredoxin domain-containing protein [Sedimentisphaerales bacterium]